MKKTLYSSENNLSRLLVRWPRYCNRAVNFRVNDLLLESSVLNYELEKMERNRVHQCIQRGRVQI